METKRYGVEYGALVEVPCWEKHHRGKNWAAIIEPDPRAPGGLKRVFLEKAHGSRYFYMVDGLEPGQAVEFGADYYTGGGNKVVNRAYALVAGMSSEYVELALFDSAKEALQAARGASRGANRGAVEG